MSRFYTRAGLVQQRAEWRAQGLRVVFTNGAYDILHPGHIRLLEQAGLLEAVWLSQKDITQIEAPESSGVLVANPPYGVRIGEQEELAALYPKIGETLKKKFAGWNAYFLTSDLRLPKLMRLAPSKKTPLYNGPLECRLFEIRMVAGSNRKDVKGEG